MSTGVIGITDSNNKLREEFFLSLFRELEGYLCIAHKKPKDVSLSQSFFRFPGELDRALDYINRSYSGSNVYFGTQLYTEPHRLKANIAACNTLWADLDECSPRDVAPTPSITVVTSSGRYHGLWLLDNAVEPDIAEDASRRIAYFYRQYGADVSGWDLTQLLRVPRTYNVNYGANPVVDIDSHLSTYELYSLKDFKHLTSVPGFEYMQMPMPDLPKVTAEQLLEQYRMKLDQQVMFLFTEAPTTTQQGWSGSLWKLECLLIEAGMSAEEAFIVCVSSACNKYRRDGRDESALWRDVVKARDTVEARRTSALLAEINFPPLLTQMERARLDLQTFVHRFARWGAERTDASIHFHEAGAFVLLSSILAARIEFRANVGPIKPNLWILIMGSTTTARKTTSMNIAMDVLRSVDREAVLATDGSLEGIMSAIAFRPGRSGIFHRDEFSGLLASIAKKDYMAGMAETLTGLYDGTDQRRVLRRDVIDMRDPVLIIYAGGVTGRIMEHLSEEQIFSGFVPRFIFVEGDQTIKNRRPLAPISDEFSEQREDFIAELAKIERLYQRTQTITVGTSITTSNPKWDVQFTPEALARHTAFENTLGDAAMKSSKRDHYEPMMLRLATSTLKAAMLLAAARQDPSELGHVEVTLDDVLVAISFADRWKDSACLVVEKAGMSIAERTLTAIYASVDSADQFGIARSELMRKHHLDARTTDLILETLDQRGMIRRVKEQGKRERVFTYKDAPAE